MTAADFRRVQANEQSNILIVDDRPENLLAFEAVLADLGCNLVLASSGKEGLRLLLQEEFALVLLDVNMPGIDGFETARLIRERHPTELLPILFVSAREPEEEDRHRAYSLGALDYVIKPFVPAILRAKVSALLDIQRRATLLEIALRERTSEIERLNDRAAKLRETVGELEAFSYSVSHDMRAPLRSMQSFAQVLAEEHGDKLPAEGKEFLQRIISSAVRLDRLITDVLAYSRVSVQPLVRETVDVGTLVQEIIEHQASLSPQAKIDVEHPFLSVIGNRASLTQCLSNLLGNAVKFVAPDMAPNVKIRTEEIDGDVRIIVEDNGIGIAPGNQARVFEAFERLNTDYDGTGFGLAIVRKAVERMGGKVGVDSELSRGSKFWIQLPKATTD